MNRRNFSRTLAGAALGSAALALDPVPNAGRTLGGASLAGTNPSAAETPFKTSVMLWTVFKDMPFEARLEKVAEAGFHAVELVGEYSKWTEDDFRRYNKKRSELGITFDCTAGLRHGSGDPSMREALLADVRAELKIMEKIECPALIIMSGDVVPGLAPQVQHNSCVEGLKRAAELVEGKGVTLLLENIDLEENPHYYLWSVPEAFKIIEEVNHPQVKFLYDFYHAQISGGNLIANLQRHAGKVGLVHIADVPGRHEPGTGEIDYNNIYKKLAELKYDRYVAMEFLPSGDPVKALARAREEALQAGRS
ncbi:MAG TPA: TIM barrel protein [Terriglobia bacterium]|nr:TIM barrel protein [Terriglobia bacterium]